MTATPDTARPHTAGPETAHPDSPPVGGTAAGTPAASATATDGGGTAGAELRTELAAAFPAVADLATVTGLGQAFTALAASRADAPAVTCGEQTLTFGELERRANRCAHAFAARGAGRGDYITIGLPNSAAFLVATVAAWKLGAIPQPVSYRLPAAELAAVVELAGSAVVVGPQVPGRPHLPGEPAADAELSDTPLPATVSPSWKAPTSGGSTGRPKLIVAGAPAVHELLVQKAPLLGIAPDSVHLCTAPLYHNGPFTFACMALMQGGHVVLMERFDALGSLQLVEQHQVTWMYVVPTMMGRIAKLPAEQREGVDVSSLQVAFSTAAACPPWVKQAWIDWLGGARVWELYGGTESQMSTVITGDDWLLHRGSVGRPIYGRVQVRDSSGAPVPAGILGEVWLHADDGVVPYRYVGATARADADGWESLGDMGRLDADGYLYLEGRNSDMIVVGGANVYPAEVEAALQEHPLVQSAIVLGLPDDDLGARLHALVQLSGEVSDDVLLAHLRERLVPYKWPRSFERVDGPLRDDADKVRRSTLQAQRGG